MLVSSLQCAGLVVSGANAAYTQTELLHQLTDSSASFVIVHPAILNVALQATTAMGWNKKQQREKIILAVVRAEAGPAIDGFKCFDDFMGYQLLTPHPIKDPKNTVAYLGYSSGTSGAAKGVRTSHYNMTVSFFLRLHSTAARSICRCDLTDCSCDSRSCRFLDRSTLRNTMYKSPYFPSIVSQLSRSPPTSSYIPPQTSTDYRSFCTGQSSPEPP